MSLNTEKHEELHEKVSEFWKIVYQARLYYKYCFRLHSVKDEQEADYVNKSRFFRNTAHVYWRTLVMEVAKLYSDRKSDYYNIPGFIRQLRDVPAFARAGIESQVLAKWELFILENQSIIKIVLGLRDRFYGHTDLPQKKEEIQYDELYIHQIEPLIATAEEIIRVIFKEAFDAGVECRVDFDEHDFDFIMILAEHQEEKLKALLGPRFTVHRNRKK